MSGVKKKIIIIIQKCAWQPGRQPWRRGLVLAGADTRERGAYSGGAVAGTDAAPLDDRNRKRAAARGGRAPLHVRHQEAPTGPARAGGTGAVLGRRQETSKGPSAQAGDAPNPPGPWNPVITGQVGAGRGAAVTGLHAGPGGQGFWPSCRAPGVRFLERRGGVGVGERGL